MDEKTSPESTSAVFAAVAADMLMMHPEDEQATMFNSPGLRTGGKFYGFAVKSRLMLKLPADRVAELITDGTGEPCSPRPGRPMREWVEIPDPDEQACRSYLAEARAFIVSLA